MCVLQHGAKGERLPATKFTQPILSAAWVGNGSIICSLHAVYVLYKGYRIPLEYPPPPHIPLDYSFSILPVLSYRNSFCSIQNFKSKSTVKKLRNFLSYWLICSCVCAVCVCASVSPSLSAPTLSLSFTISNRSEVPRKTVFWSNVSFPSSAPTSFVDIVNLTQNTLAKAFTNYDLIACCLNPTTTTATTRRVTTKKNNKPGEIISELSGLGNTL